MKIALIYNIITLLYYKCLDQPIKLLQRNINKIVKEYGSLTHTLRVHIISTLC